MIDLARDFVNFVRPLEWLLPQVPKVIRGLSLLCRFTFQVSGIGDCRCDLGMRL